MASVEKRTTKDGRASYRVKVRMKGHPPLSATFERKTDAKKWAQQTESAIRDGRYFKTVEAKRHTLAEMLDRYIRDVLPQKPRSEKDQKRQLNWWRAELGHMLLSDLTPALIAEYRDKLASGVTKRGDRRSPATVNRYLAALSHVYTIAMKEWGWVDDSPMRKVSNLKEPKSRVRFLSDDEVLEDGTKVEGERTRLLKVCRARKNQTLYTIVVIALSTGARQGEILNLRWGDLDLDRGLMVLRETKNGDTRAIPLQGHALALIKELKPANANASDLVFPSRRNSEKPISIQNIWESALKDAEIEDFRFHDLRHSAASYLAMNGATLGEIAAVLGHRTLDMVKRYAHFSQQHTVNVVASMNNKIFDGTG